MLNKVTRNDVAKLAGVSPAVVSYVMNKSNYVSEAKREAVMKAVNELKYKPDVFARALRKERSYQMALVGDTLQDELFGTLSSLLFERGFFPCLFFSRKNDEFINLLLGNRYEAIFMASNTFEASQLNEIAEIGMPLILYKSKEYSHLNEKIIVRAPDFYNDVKKTVNLLVMKGHNRIAFIPPLKYRTTGIGGTDYRAQGYTDGLKENKIEPITDFFCTSTKTMDDIFSSVLRMMTGFSKENRPTAIIASDDHMAAQIMEYLKNKLNLNCPNDVAIVGWGNIASSKITTPALTTLDSEISLFAHELAEALIKLSDGEQPESKLYPGKLILRQST